MEEKKNKQISKEELVELIKSNIKTTLIYWISIYGLYTLCTLKLYSYEYKSVVQLLFTLFILGWFIGLFLRTGKKNSTSPLESLEEDKVQYRYKKLWSVFFAILLIAITITYVTKTHESYKFNIKYFMGFEKIVNARAAASISNNASKNGSIGQNTPGPQNDNKSGTNQLGDKQGGQTANKPGSETSGLPNGQSGNQANGQQDTQTEAEDIAKLMKDSSRIVGECFISKFIGYRVLITDAALGSRFYSLFITRDGGSTWSVLNRDPFSQRLGSSSGVFFISENIGFLTLGHSSNSEGQLYRTVDGGKSFKEVAIRDSRRINFDFPEAPFMKDGILSMYLSQGDNGDYNGGSKGLYQSKDNGVTWEFVREVDRSEFQKN